MFLIYLLLIFAGIAFYFVLAFVQMPGRDPKNKALYISTAVFIISTVILTYVLANIIRSERTLNSIVLVLLLACYTMTLVLLFRNGKNKLALPVFVDFALGLGLLYFIAIMLFELFASMANFRIQGSFLPDLCALGLQGLFFLLAARRR